MTDSKINFDVTVPEALDYNREDPDVLLMKIADLEIQCLALQEYNREMEQSRDHYATVIEYSPVGYVLLDEQAVITGANMTVATMLGMKKEKMMNLPFAQLVMEQDIELFSTHIRRCKVTKSRVCTEVEMKSPSGKIFCAQIVSFPFTLLDSQTFYYNTAIVDVSVQKQLEAEIQRLDRLHLIGEMAAGIAHEIRNPMTTVRGYLQLYERRSSNQQELEDIQLMLEELDRANAIITEFLALGKNKKNKLMMVDVNGSVEAIRPLVEAEARMGGKEILVELSTGLPDVLIDSKEIRQVLLNLVSNALQSMERGVVTIRTFLEGEEVVVTVTDQGSGIPDEIRHKIGTPFFTTRDDGTGLGMAICYSIIERHRAKLTFITNPFGTTFFIRFPLKKNLITL
jgi:PAS domain S-box-containing protein